MPSLRPVLAWALALGLSASCSTTASDSASSPTPIKATTTSSVVVPDTAGGPTSETAPPTAGTAVTETPAPPPGDRTTSDGVSIVERPGDGGEGRTIEASTADGKVALDIGPDAPAAIGPLQALAWAGDGRLAIVAVTAGPEVDEVLLLAGSEVVDSVRPDAARLASVGARRDLASLTVVAHDAQGRQIASCAQDPTYTSLLTCAAT